MLLKWRQEFPLLSFQQHGILRHANGKQSVIGATDNVILIKLLLNLVSGAIIPERIAGMALNSIAVLQSMLSRIVVGRIAAALAVPKKILRLGQKKDVRQAARNSAV